MSALHKRFICTLPLNQTAETYCRWAMIDESGFVDGETPIEDFGMFLILDEEVTSKEAFNILVAIIQSREICNKTEMVKLSEKENRIFNELTKNN